MQVYTCANFFSVISKNHHGQYIWALSIWRQKFCFLRLLLIASTLSPVWNAFTKAEILDQWVAHKPWTSRTKFMDFKVGGRRFYAMVSPEGHEHWVIQKYTFISPKTNFKLFNTFADKDENPELPCSDWDYTLSEQNGKITLRTTIYNESLDRMEKMVEMDFKEGVHGEHNQSGKSISDFIEKGTEKLCARTVLKINGDLKG